jgi:TonB dependent receptor-like, beta-barrel/Carboxypeptidase regulatory-like domain/TonB-dependent Receptor Plug Domain
MHRTIVLVFLLILLSATADATIFGTVRGRVLDAQGKALAGATLTLEASQSSAQRTTTTDGQGAFAFVAVPVGGYVLRAEAPGLQTATRTVTVDSGARVDLSIVLQVPSKSERVEVTAESPTADLRSATTKTTVRHLDIVRTPGADQANSLAMITDFVPGSYVVHDQLHIRGGHQVSWLVDGVPVPNTNIASNVGPQFHPADVQTIEVQRGGFSAAYGDRTYAMFNVLPRSGFDRDDQMNAALSIGSHQTGAGRLDLGSHTDRLAYFGSLDMNRSDYGLETPVATISHDATSGMGLFGSVEAEATPGDQLRLVLSARRDKYEIPTTPDLEAAGVRDTEREHDALINASWVHMLGASSLLTVSPFFHENTADFRGGPTDPIQARDRRSSHYLGGQVTLEGSTGENNWRAGVYAFRQRDDVLFALQANDGSGLSLSEVERPTGHLEALFLEDRIDLTPWLTIRGGLRTTRFAGDLRESATSPRIGAAVRLPWRNAVLHASWGRAYQAPPLSTVSGPLLDFALDEGFDFLPLRGERDRMTDVGLSLPAGSWSAEIDAFRNNARNFFDHDALANSDIFFPLTIDRAYIRGVEASVQSPEIAGRLNLHLAYSHQTVEGEGAVVGGLTDFEPPDEGRYALDHDQRNTLAAVVRIALPRSSWLAGTISYGSGFLRGDGPSHLPGHTTFDLALGTTVNDWSVKLTALNLAGDQYLLDESNTFGGTHYSPPRQILAEIGYRFRY